LAGFWADALKKMPLNKMITLKIVANFLLLVIGDKVSCIMNIKITANTLKKLEQLFEEARYIIRFEKGTFNSGYCILEDKRVVVVNKFLNLEGRINALSEILPSINVIEGDLSTESLKFYKQIMGDYSPNIITIQTEMDI
jgi:hypothetical protein